MTNEEKYKTAKERTEAFWEYYNGSHIPFEIVSAFASWLNLEVEEEKPLPCPFCGGEVKVGDIDNESEEATEFYIHCECCHITTTGFATREDLLSMWNNRVTISKNDKEVKK